MVELEALSIVWAVKKCYPYRAGLPHFTVVVDHRPLVPIFNNQTMDMVENPKLQSYKAKLSRFNFTVSWCKGKDHAIPDALSRAPVSDPEPEENEGEMKAATIAAADLVESNPDIIIQQLESAAQSDQNYINLIEAINNDFKGILGPLAKAVKKIKNELSVSGHLVLKGAQIVIPDKYRKKVLQHLHAAHQGVERTKRRARQTVYWPGISNDIKTTIEACAQCSELAASNPKEPIRQEPIPGRCFETVSSDLFEIGSKTYMVYTDRLSGFPFVAQFSATPATEHIIRVLRDFFSITGVPLKFKCDNGPQYRSRAFKQFLFDLGVSWAPSSPYNHQSNGHAEVNVKSVKHLLLKCPNHDTKSPEFTTGLLELRNTPREDGHSPAEWLFGRKLRGVVPMHPSAFENLFNPGEALNKLHKYREGYRHRYNQRAHPLPPLFIGDNVRVQDPNTKRWTKLATIEAYGSNPRTYVLRWSSGAQTTRNRRFLRLVSTNVKT